MYENVLRKRRWCERRAGYTINKIRSINSVAISLKHSPVYEAYDEKVAG
jgi:hypothetical protein